MVCKFRLVVKYAKIANNKFGFNVKQFSFLLGTYSRYWRLLGFLSSWLISRYAIISLRVVVRIGRA